LQDIQVDEDGNRLAEENLYKIEGLQRRVDDLQDQIDDLYQEEKEIFDDGLLGLRDID